MNVIQRVQAPTPKFFKVLRTIGLTLVAVSGAILTAPLSLPTIIVTVAGYLGVAGAVMSAVSQTTVDENTSRQKLTRNNGGGSGNTGRL